MYFIIILLIIIFMIICYKTENYTCNQELPVNMHRLYAHNDIENLLKNYKPKPDILHRTNPYYNLLINIDKLFKPIPINLHQLNIANSKVDAKLINNKSNEIINILNKLVKEDSKINQKRYRCRVRPIKILPPTKFKMYNISNQRAYLIKDRFTVHNNTIYTIFALTIYNVKDKYANFLIFNIHLIDNKISKVKYMTLKSTDNYLLNTSYDSNSMKYRDYDTTNIDDNLLPDVDNIPELDNNYLLNNNGISTKRIKKYLKDRENNLLSEIDENSTSEDLNRLFEDQDILDELKHKKKLENDNEKEIDERLANIRNDNEDEDEDENDKDQIN